jgi:tyrosyl-tRNA synthetase
LKLGKWKLRVVNIISDEQFKEQGLTAPGWEEFQAEQKAKEAEAETSE